MNHRFFTKKAIYKMALINDIFNHPDIKKTLAKIKVADWITDNLKHEIRPYQAEAFKRFMYLESEGINDKIMRPYHLLFNMATGSGKTLVMAGLILHLYQKGYRNFLFFVNSNNIIQKTKDNFLNPNASKYLFKDKISIHGNSVHIKEVNNFDEADNQNINIKFASIQMLTSGLLLNVSENGLSFDDFENRKFVLIGDEAHHNNAEVWGELIGRIHNMNIANVLLEFTATFDYESREIIQKYQDKVIYKYDLSQFRIDKYSKEIQLICSQYDEQERIIQALILNIYRQELATSNNINLKPVILFKAKQTIKESEANKANFHELIDNFSVSMIDNIQKSSSVSIVRKAFDYFAKNNISNVEIVQRIQANFRFENCLSANNDLEAEKNQILLNTLDDENNPIRAIFAVQKLNEGWDVLNLFDIVRLYEERDGTTRKTGKTTMSEAQLIGRGARYFPFAIEPTQDKYKRKFDDEVTNDLKILETLYYHTKEDSRYITDLKKALVEIGICETNEDFVSQELILKEAFKQSDFYKSGNALINKKIPTSYLDVQSLVDMGVDLRQFSFTLASGAGLVSDLFNADSVSISEKPNSKTISLGAFPKHVVRYALAQNSFFYFDNLKKYFPNISGLSAFIESKLYLGGLDITFNASEARLHDITNEDYLQAVRSVLHEIENILKTKQITFTGSKFFLVDIHSVIKDKEIIVYKADECNDGQISFVLNAPWYVYNTSNFTKEEEAFVSIFALSYSWLNQKYSDVYLIRNERQLRFFDSFGSIFTPDFVLFCQHDGSQTKVFQVLIFLGKYKDSSKIQFINAINKENIIHESENLVYTLSAIMVTSYLSIGDWQKYIEHLMK